MSREDGSKVEFSIQWRALGIGEEWHEGYPLRVFSSRKKALEVLKQWSQGPNVEYSEYRIVKRIISAWKAVKG